MFTPRNRHLARWVRPAVLTLFAIGGGATCALAQSDSDTSPVGYLIYRTYLPSGGPSRVDLPTLTYTYSDGRPSRTLPPCRTVAGSAGLLPALAAAATFQCSWPAVVSGSSTTVGLNVAYPDTASTYWVMPFVADPALTITAHGTYPDARYMSFNVYNSNGASFTSSSGVKSGRADYLIEPDNGALNPWQTSAPIGGHYTVVVSSDATPTSTGNVLPMPLPGKGIGGLTPICTTDCPPYNVFLPAKLAGLWPNVDNAYLEALTQPEAGKVIVVRGKLPVTVKGKHAHPWPAEGAQLRYFSVCNNLYASPYPVTSCVYDDELAVDSAGYYTVVAGAPGDRPKNTGPFSGVAWLRGSTTQPFTRHRLQVRNMLSNGFPQSVLAVPKGASAAETESVMQDYYPHTWVCPKTTFESGGWQACAATPQPTAAP